MSQTAKRGTKRTCPSCNIRFYDLNRTVMPCPGCGAEFKVEDEDEASDPVLEAEVAAAATKAAPAAPAAVAEPPPPPKIADDDDLDDDDDTEAAELADIEDADTEDVGDDADDTFLENEEDDGANVTDIIGTPVDSDSDDT